MDDDFAYLETVFAGLNTRRTINLRDMRGILTKPQVYPNFTGAFRDRLHNALQTRDQGDIDWIDSYLAPDRQELTEIGIPEPEPGPGQLMRCTDSGLLVGALVLR